VAATTKPAPVSAVAPAGVLRIVRSRTELREALADAPRPIGLVPTMGWLHDGHRALIERARADNATTVVSIFVNPRQFGDPADLEKYPRSEARDIAICTEEGVDLVFAPDVEEVYPPGFDTTVKVGAVARPLEGAARPGHFDGVATVVAILFDLVGAEHAYFGQKDAQQLLVIRRMALDLALPTEVIGCPTVREPDGLAMSSRNVHLSPEERAAAPVIRRALGAARSLRERGERSAEALRGEMRRVLATEPLANPEYVSVADGSTLQELETVDVPALLSTAVHFGSTRLIDNEPIA
jgi:pantoate--beta-alanine ligase